MAEDISWFEEERQKGERKADEDLKRPVIKVSIL